MRTTCLRTFLFGESKKKKKSHNTTRPFENWPIAVVPRHNIINKRRAIVDKLRYNRIQNDITHRIGTMPEKDVL